VVIPPARGSVNQSLSLFTLCAHEQKTRGCSQACFLLLPFHACMLLQILFRGDDECNPISREKTVLQSYFLDDAGARKQQQRKIHRDLREQEEKPSQFERLPDVSLNQASGSPASSSGAVKSWNFGASKLS